MKKNMQEYVELTSVKKETESALKKATQQIQSSVAAIRCIKEIPPLPKDLAQINAKFVEDSIFPHIEAVKAEPTLTESEKEEKVNNWQQIQTQALTQVQLIAEVVEEWSDVEWKWSENLCNFVAANIDTVIEKRSTFPIPVEAQEHFKLIRECYECVKRLREWESARDCKTIPLMTLTRYTQNQIAEAWLSGDATVNHKYDSLFQRVGIVNESYKGMIIF